MAKLSEVCNKIGSGATPRGGKEVYCDNGISLIRSQNVSDYEFLYDGLAHINEEQASKLNNVVVEPEDVLLNITGDSVARACIVPDDVLPARVNQHVAIIRKNPELVESKYILYLLEFNKLKLLKMAEAGATRNALTKAMIEEFEFNLPDLKVQKKIVDILGILDEKISLNRNINENLEQQAQAIFKKEFINIPSTPIGWEHGNLLEIADYLNGLAMQKFRPQSNEVGVPVLKIKELRQGSCDSSSEFCSPNIKPEYFIYNGDVVFSWSGSLLVDFWCGEKCGLNQHLFKVTSQNYDKWFYYLWTNYHLQKFIAIAADMATTMGHIKREELSKSDVLIPNEEDYIRIGSILQPLYDMIISNRIENRKLASIRDSLLPQLMSGEVDLSEVTL